MTTTAYLTRIVHFSSAHRYYRPEWSEERNRELFGACANPHGHGHNYSLEVMVAGVPNAETGFCVDLAALDKLMKEKVVARLDHQHVNHAIPEFADGRLVPTTENLVIWIWQEVVGGMRDARLVRLRLREDPDLFVDYFGPGEEPVGQRRREIEV